VIPSAREKQTKHTAARHGSGKGEATEVTIVVVAVAVAVAVISVLAQKFKSLMGYFQKFPINVPEGDPHS
jgi:hypothetical protein